MATTKDVKRLPSGRISYRGETFGVLTNPSVLPVNQRKVLFWLRRAPKSNWFDLAIQICPSRRTNQNAVVILGLAIPAIQPRINLAPVIGLVRLGDPMSEPNLQEIDKKSR